MLLTDLNVLSGSYEILFIHHGIVEDLQEMTKNSHHSIRLIECNKNSRAGQMNAGAKEAVGEALWFLHADSRLAENTEQILLNKIKSNPNDLLFFDLAFLQDKDAPALSWRMRINEIGAFVRSRLLKIPFGDQGFCLKRTKFLTLGGYDESVKFGEDHVLVWQAHLAGISITPTRLALRTSARKYRQKGWLFLTLRYQGLWLWQAFPYFIKLIGKMFTGKRRISAMETQL